MNNHMSLKLVGANSSLELNSPITSIYLQEELTGLTTLPGIRETKGMNIGMDGGWTSAQFYEPRLITIKGVIANQDVAVVEQRRKQLIQLLAEKRLALEFQTEAGNHYTMNVVVAGVQMPLSKVLTASYFQISLRADDPLIYDNNALAELEAILRRSSSASSGFTINFPINFQLGTSESRPTIDNFGSSVIYPTITLTGPLTTPEIVNITTNMAFTIDEVLGAGTYTASGIRGAIDQEGSVDTYSGNPIQATRDAESPISKFSLYGNAEQTTYSGKNLADLVPMATATITSVNYATAEIVNDATLNRQVLHMTATGDYPTALYTFPQRLESGKYYSMTIKYRSSYTGTQPNYYKEMWIAPNWFGNNWDTLNSFANGRGKNQDGVSGAKIQQSTAWTTATFRFYIDPAQYADVADSYKRLNISMGQGIVSGTTAKEMWIADIMLAEITQAQWDATTYADDDFEPYVGGTASPNPDYPQTVNTTTGENVVKITGKNLLNPLTLEQGSFNYYTNVDNSDANRIRSGLIPCQPSTQYSISANSNLGEVGVAYLESDGTTPIVGIGASVAGKTYSFTTKANVYYLRVRVGNTSNPFVIGSDYNIQLELGSTATSYEPYQGQDYELNLGKNLLENTRITTPTTTNAVTATPNADGTISLSGTATALTWFVLNNTMSVPAGTYTLSGGLGSGSGVAMYNDGWGGTEVAKTVTLASKSTGNWSIRIASGTNTNGMVVKPQLEKGSTATAYAPYFTPIELAKIGNYQDKIYKTEGKWYVEKQVGKVAININGYNSSYTNVDYAIFDKPTDALNYDTYSVMPALCESAVSPETTGGYNQTAQIGRLCSQANKTHLWIGVAKGTTQATAKTMLDGKSVYYALATPYDTEITNEALIDQLDAVLEAHLYEGVNNISNVTAIPNLSGGLEIKTGQTLTVINSLSIVGSSGTAEIGLGGSELAMVGGVADELTINGTTGAVTKTTRIGKIASYAGETITTDYISTSGGLDSDATIYYVLPSSSTSVINTLDSTALTAFNNVVASGGVSAQTNIGSISVDVTTVTAQDVAVVDTKQHTITINGVGAYSKFSGDWLTLDVGLNELQLITENNTDTGSAVIKYRVGYMGV